MGRNFRKNSDLNLADCRGSGSRETAGFNTARHSTFCVLGTVPQPRTIIQCTFAQPRLRFNKPWPIRKIPKTESTGRYVLEPPTDLRRHEHANKEPSSIEPGLCVPPGAGRTRRHANRAPMHFACSVEQAFAPPPRKVIPKLHARRYYPGQLSPLTCITYFLCDGTRSAKL
jgi:hypothetical protein